MWILLIIPVAVIAIVSVVAALRRAPALPGIDPPGLRSVVLWRDSAAIAADVAGDTHEQLRQLVGALAEHRFILSSSIDRANGRPSGRAGDDAQPVAIIDVHELRFELRARPWRGGRWLLWINQRGHAPLDSSELRQLLTGLYRTLEERHAEGVAWHRRERLAAADRPAPSPFYVD